MLPKASFTGSLASLTSACILTALAGCASEPIAPKAVASQTYAANFGWREVVQDGKTLYCSSVLPTGSHIAPGCLTEAAAQHWLLVQWAFSHNPPSSN